MPRFEININEICNTISLLKGSLLRMENINISTKNMLSNKDIFDSEESRECLTSLVTETGQIYDGMDQLSNVLKK